jgi:3-oxoadipate enol-lactonase
MRSKYVQVDGVAVNYLHTGQATLPSVRPALDAGELLVFVHGAGWNAGFWRRQLRQIEGSHSALAFDFPGHDRSASTEGLRSVGAYAEFLAAFVAELELRPFVLVGSGLGGAVAARFAAQHPKRVRGLVLAATPPRFAPPATMIDVWAEVMRGRAAQPFATELFAPDADFALMREVWTEQVKTDPRVRYYDLLAFRDSDLAEDLAEVRVPTLVVGGAGDQIVAPASVEATHAQIAGSRLAMIADAGHCVGVEQAESFHRGVGEFLGALAHE